MVTRYGMNETLGQVTYEGERQAILPQVEGFSTFARSYSEQTAWQIDEAVRHVIELEFEKATRILERNRELLDETAATLLVRETLSAADLPQVPPMSPRRPHRRAAAVPRHSGHSELALNTY